jgi:uncharacterized protein YbbK (DUF523 family)
VHRSSLKKQTLAKNQDHKMTAKHENAEAPLLLVSACLLGEHCRYDGKLVPELDGLEDFTLRSICPEVAIGLPVPRDPITLVGSKDALRLKQRVTGEDLTKQMRSYCTLQAQGLLKEGCVGAVLKARSPSCGAANAERFLTQASFESHGRLKAGESPTATLWPKNVAKMNGDGLLVQALMKQDPDFLIINEDEWAEPNMRASFLAAVRGESLWDMPIEDESDC